MISPYAQQFLTALEQSLADSSFIKLGLSAYIGADPALKKIDVRPVIIKRVPQLSFTYHHKTRDIVKNHAPADGLSLLQALITQEFRAATLCTTGFDLLLENAAGRKPLLKKKAPSSQSPASLSHDVAKERPLEAAGQKYLYDLKITDAQGAVLKSAQDKYRQINKYIEILSGLLKGLPADRPLRIADMGAGKGYLTFALYDYLSKTAPVKITGVEHRADLVGLCNKIAADSGFTGLDFVEGSIATYDASGTDVLIALHACDTATDDAIYKGIKAGASLIVVAPCCHKQIRREMEATTSAPADLDFLMRHGIFMERQAEMVTDGLRSLLLEYSGYTTKVFEFISDAHTPKNVMIVGTKHPGAVKSIAALKRYEAAKAKFGIAVHHLEKLLGL